MLFTAEPHMSNWAPVCSDQVNKVWADSKSQEVTGYKRSIVPTPIYRDLISAN
jgi:hypothetical protein